MPNQDIINKIAMVLEPKQKELISIAVLASGGGSNLQALLDFSLQKECYFKIDAVITNTPKSLSLTRAEMAGVRGYLINHKQYDSRESFEKQLVSVLQSHHVELVVLAGFMRVLSGYFLSHYKDRVINLHPSLLPKHRGLKAIEKAMVANDKQTGCTVHLVDEGLDTGPIIAQSTCPIFKSDNLLSLTGRVQSLEHVLLPQVVNKIAQACIKKAFV